MGLLTKEQTVATSNGDEEDLDNDGDDDYSDKNDADYICNDDDSEDHGSGDDNCSDDYRCNDDDSNDDGDDIDNDDDGGATDNLCAICDNGGQLLCCEGQCKRSFHPRKKDGRDTNCETLGLTSAQLQEIAHYLCKNCEYKQHQCFSCGDLEPSDGPNAKVFQCYKASCGHFYHPSCITKLLEPDDTDGARELEKRIAAGMPFTCPAHWCSECRTMGDNTKESLWLAACRRCPVSYHKKCLPRRISFEKKRGSSVRAWLLDDRIIIYCRRHKLEATLGAPRRDHIKLPSSTKTDTVGAHCMDQIKLTSAPEIDRTRDLAKKKRKVTGKRKMNTDQGSTGTAELSNKVCPEEVDQNQTVDMNNLREDIIPKGRGVLEKETIRLNQAHNDELEKLIVEEQAEEDENNTKSGKERETRRRENAYGENTCDRTRDLAKKKRKVTGRRKMKTDQGSTGTAELPNKVCREEADQAQTVDMNNIRKDIIPKGRGVLEKGAIRLSQAQNDELEQLIMEEQAEEDETNTKSGKERETCRRENAYVEKEKTPGNKSNKFGLTNGRFTSGSNGDREIDGSYAFQKELKSPHWNDNHRETGIDTSSDKSRKRQRQEEQATDGNLLDLESNKKKFHMETGRDARQSPQHLHNYKKPDARQSPQHLHNHKKSDAHQSSCCSSSKNHPRRNDDQRSSMTFEYKSREGRGSSREEWRNNLRENSYRGQSPLGRRNPQNRSKRHSLEGRRMEYRNSNPRSNNQHRYEQHRQDDYFRDDDGGKRRRSCPEDYASDVDIAGRRPHRHEDYCSDVDIGGRRPSRREDYYSDGDRRRSSQREDYSSDGDIGGRRLSPQQSAFPPDNFGTRLSPPLYPRTEYGASRRHGSPPYQRRPERVTSGRRGPYLNPRGSDHADYEMERRKVPFHHNPPNAEYDGYTDLEYRGHHAMDVAPAERYSLREDSPGAYGPETDAGMGEGAAFRGGRFSDRGARSDHSRRNRMNSEDRAFAAGSVTDRYVPRLDRTNHPVRGECDQPDYPLW